MTTDGRRPLASGLTLREEFARSAMVGLLSGDTEFPKFAEWKVAELSVEHADALIAELNGDLSFKPDPEDE